MSHTDYVHAAMTEALQTYRENVPDAEIRAAHDAIRHAPTDIFASTRHPDRVPTDLLGTEFDPARWFAFVDSDYLQPPFEIVVHKDRMRMVYLLILILCTPDGSILEARRDISQRFVTSAGMHLDKVRMRICSELQEMAAGFREMLEDELAERIADAD